jgi:two-component system chemotaxis sensor kinase CheA
MAPRDPFRYFRVEARELLDGLGQALLQLEREGDTAEALARLLRHAHTLKGAARVVKHQALAELAHAVEGALEPWRASSGPLPSGLAPQISTLLDAMARHLASLESGPAPEGPAAAPAPAKAPEASSLREVPRLDTVRLEVAEIDGVMDGLREAAGRLTTFKSQAAGALDGRATATLEQAERELVLAHDKAGRLRLLPASLLFDFLERVARDAAAVQGKLLRFSSSGSEQRLDAPMLSGLQEALQHVVRNAVVHGLEDPRARAAAGKAPQGELRLELRRQGGEVILRCSDDGQGIAPERVRQAALAKGRLGAGAPQDLDMEAAIALLLAGGLSTAPELTDLSGRGLGLDVLRRSVEGLRGQLRVRSRAGEGTEVEIQVPASLSSYDALAVEAGGLPLLIPFQGVRQTLRLDPQMIVRSPAGDTLLWQGEALPYLRLSSLFARGEGGARSALVVQGGAGLVALAVDRILGVREAVVLPLPELAPNCEVVAGACLDSLGDPCLVLDPDGLARRARSQPGGSEEEAPQERLPLLVVDDSMTTRMLEQSILETAGYRVEVAASGEEGLARLGQQRFGLILVDVEMPGMNGFEFLERLRAEPQLREIPAIMVTSRDAPQDRRRGQAAGARDYVVKGEFDQSRLLRRIRELLA